MLAFPRFCLGTHNLIGSGGINTREINKIYMKALDKNIKFYDTADEYGKGNSEIILGKFIRNNKLSSKVKIASKIGQLIDFSPYKLQKSIDNSLKRLNIERLDIMYFHSGSNKQFFNDNFWKIMNKNKSLGKIKHLGLSLKTKYFTETPFIEIDALVLKKITFRTNFSYSKFSDEDDIINEYKFFNASVSYRSNEESKFEFEIKANNLLNTKSQSQSSTSNIFVNTTEYFVQPRFITFRLIYSL